MMVFRGISELERAVGTYLGHSDWYTVTQKQIDAFAEASGDFQWIHVDPGKAAQGPFGATVAHGFLTLSLVPLLTRQIYRVEGVKMSVNYGADKLRFPSPLPVNSKVRAGVELLSVEAGNGGYRVAARVTVEREGSNKPACVVEALSLVLP
ncbi:dehydratase [Frankia sp. R43]|uniref:MaoC family dehydratase n=1 Tax=Frankia sp. R43 TaxID=269536 RepID=UPI0006CA0440|nr:MaoC family dehydratase [Frankia sp. R43]KPM50584.1 dehydratase [Frankia sp. R43]